MNFETTLDSPNFKSLPQRYKIQLELKDHIISKLQNQIKDMTEELFQTKTVLYLIKDQFLSLLKKIINNRKKFPKEVIKTQIINEYLETLSNINKNSGKSFIDNNDNNLNNEFTPFNDYFSYFKNNQKSFAFSNRYNVLMDEYLNNLYKRGNYKQNSIWLNYNKKFKPLEINETYKKSNSFYSTSSPFKNKIKRRKFGLDNSFSYRNEEDYKKMRTLSERGSKRKGIIKNAFKDFSNRSFSTNKNEKITHKRK